MKLVLIGALLGLAVTLTAAPKLRLETAALGPLYIATGQDGTLHSIQVNNNGDGALNLSVTSNVAWLAPSIGNEGQLLVNFMFFTAKLARGTYTGVATVTDPVAIDAPQSITVTIVIGSGSTIPDSVDFYAAPGTTTAAAFYTNCASTQVTNPSGGPQISIATPDGVVGTFARSCQVLASTIAVTAPAGTPDGDYEGSITFSNSYFAQDNRTVPVAVHVGPNPVASVQPPAIFFRMAQNDPQMSRLVSFTGTGQTSLVLSSASSSVLWLSATVHGTQVILTADASKLAPGNFSAQVMVSSNVANGQITIPVVLTVLPAGPPVTYFQGVVDNALFRANDRVAPGGIVALFGERLTAGGVVSAAALPLSPTLGGASVFVNEIPAPVYYASPSQLNFIVPFGTRPGDALVRVDRDGQRGNSVSFQVTPTAPRLLRLGDGDYALAVLGDMSTYPLPASPWFSFHPARAGVDTVVFYALGLGQTSPPALDGQAAQGLPQVDSVKAVIGFPIQPAYAGLTPGSVGLYQVNVPLPANVPKGDAVPVFLTMPGGVSSNTVNIAIQ